MSLNEKQQTFAIEYAKTNNATQSAITAGYNNPKQYSYQLLNNPVIKQEIDKIRQEQDLAMQAQFRAGAVEAFECLMSIIRDTEGNPQHRVSASKDILNRAYGEKQEHTIEVSYLDSVESIDAKLEKAFLTIDRQRDTETDIINAND